MSTPSRAELPFLVTHGSWLWVVVLALLVAATTYAFTAIRARRAARANRTAEPRAGRRLLAIAVTTLAWGIALWQLGSAALDRVKVRPGAIDRLEPFGAAAIAAAMPGSRDDVLAELRDRLERHGRSPDALALEVALVELDGDCPVRPYLRRVLLDDALATARRCGDPATTAHVAWLLGHHDEAAALVDPVADWNLATKIAIARGDWKQAARGAERLAQQYATGGSTHGREWAAGARCLGALFLHFAGEQPSFRTIADHAGSSRCRLLEALTLPPDQQAAAIASAYPRLDDALLASSLWFAAGGEPGAGHSYALRGEGAPLWFAPFIAEAHAAYPARGPHADLVRLAMIAGDFPRARDALERARQEGMLDATANMLEGELLIRIGSREIPPHVVAESHVARIGDAIAARTGRPVRRTLIDAPPCAPDDAAAAYARAQQGDGAALASFLERCRTYGTQDGLVIAGVLPHVTEHRAKLAEVLRLQRQDVASVDVDAPFALVERLALQRDLARLVGEETDAATLQATIDRHAKVLADRRAVIALAYWPG